MILELTAQFPTSCKVRFILSLLLFSTWEKRSHFPPYTQSQITLQLLASLPNACNSHFLSLYFFLPLSFHVTQERERKRACEVLLHAWLLMLSLCLKCRESVDMWAWEQEKDRASGSDEREKAKEWGTSYGWHSKCWCAGKGTNRPHARERTTAVKHLCAKYFINFTYSFSDMHHYSNCWSSFTDSTQPNEKKTVVYYSSKYPYRVWY